MKILVTGDRNWDDFQTMVEVLSQYDRDTILVHGAAKGADIMAGFIGQQFGWEIRPYPANWEKHHRAAGPIRNRLMFDTEQPDLVIAFHKNLAESKGTKDMVKYAEKKGVTVRKIV